MRLSILAAAAAIAATAAVAQDGPSAEERAVDARQSHMTLFAWNLGTIGAMAQGAVPFDAAVAQAAAENLDRLAQIDQTGYWIEGTAQGEVEDSQALPAIWENMDDFNAKHDALEQAVANLVTASADESQLGAALGGVGQACGACHQNYRAPQD